LGRNDCKVGEGRRESNKRTLGKKQKEKGGSFPLELREPDALAKRRNAKSLRLGEKEK